MNRTKLTLCLFASLPAFLVSPPVVASEPVSTEVYGVTSLHVAGGGSSAAPRISLISPGFLQAVEWRGVAREISGNTIAVEAAWEPDWFNGAAGRYFVEVANGPHRGLWSDIIATASGSITTLNDLSPYLAWGGAINIRRHLTLEDLFSPVNGLQLKAATSIRNADEVMIYDGGTSTTYWRLEHPTNVEISGWYTAGAVRANDVVVAPHHGIIIRRKGEAPAILFTAGAVSSTPIRLPVISGMNVIPMMNPRGVTLQASGLYTGNPATGLKGAASPLGADLVTLYHGSGTTSYWVLQHPTQPSLSGWYDVHANPANDVLIAPGASFVIERKAGAFHWLVPPPFLNTP